MKTISLKKVSAVAVASLGFGLLSVVPVSASTMATTVSTISAAATNVTVAGGSGTITIGATLSAATAASDVLISTVTVVGPSAAAAASTAPVVTCVATVLSGNAANAASNTSGGITFTDGGTVHLASGANTLGTCTFPTALVGAYVVTVTATATTLVLTSSTPASTTIYAGYDAGGTVNTLKAFPTVGSNTTTGWAGTAGGIATVRVTNLASSTQYYATIDKGSIISGVENDTGTKIATITNTNGTNLAGGFGFLTAASNIAGNSMDITVSDTGSVASTTVTVSTYNATTGAATTFVTATVTWGVSAAPTAQYSLLTLNAADGTTATGAADDITATTASRSLSSGAAVEKFTIQVVVKDQYNVAYTGATLGASVTGPASLGISGTSTNGNTTVIGGTSVTAAMTSSSIGSITVYNNGVAGTAVISITATTAAGVTVALGSKTVKFAGSASKVAVSQNQFIAKAGTQLGLTPAVTNTTGNWSTSANTPAFQVSLTDSLGNAPMAGSTVKMTSSDATVIVVGTCAELTTVGSPAATNPIAAGTFDCSVSGATGAASGKSATVSFSVLNTTTAAYDILGTPITFTIGGAIAKCAITTDKTSYDPGAGVNLTATCTDSSGNKAYDGQKPYAALASNKTFGGALPVTTTTEISNGKTSTTGSTGVAGLYAPSVVGAVTISGKAAVTDDAPTGTAFSVALSVNDGNAALLTQIDALNAKIVALNALIAKIMKKLGVK